jgi:hypothetical protein
VAAALLAIGAYVMAGGATVGGRKASATGHPSHHELARAVDRLAAKSQRLQRQGIYVVEAGPARNCVAVRLANPTPANREYLRRHVSRLLCVSHRPAGGGFEACAAAPGNRQAGAVVVPDVVGRGFENAAERAVAADLSYTYGCPGRRHRRVKRIDRRTPLAMARVTAQCPAAGEHVPPGTEMRFAGVALLPGGFDYHVGASDVRKGRGRSSRCASP